MIKLIAGFLIVVIFVALMLGISWLLVTYPLIAAGTGVAFFIYTMKEALV